MAIFTQDEFIKFVEDTYLAKLAGQEASDDRGGFRIVIEDSREISGRFHLRATGPTGAAHTVRNVVAEALDVAARDIYTVAWAQRLAPVEERECGVQGCTRRRRPDSRYCDGYDR